MKKSVIYIIVAFLIFSFSTRPLANKIKEMNALKLHIDSFVVDSHNDTMMKIIDEETWLPVIDIRNETNNHIDIPKMRAGNLRVAFFAAYSTAYGGDSVKSLSRTLALINALYWTEKNNSDIFNITTSYKEIERALIDWRIAAVPSIEGAYSMTKENGIELLKQYSDLGVKAIAFTWNFSNDLGEGANGVYDDAAATKSSGGLTSLGKEAVKEMNRLGMIVDVSHMNEDTFWGVINTTKAPIIASHSGVYALKPHQRNLKDDQLKAIKENGGVAAMVLYRGFLTVDKDAYLKDYMDHIDYAVDLIGIDHVAIGSDFDGGELPFDMKDASELYKITEELVKRGYEEEDIKKLLGRNTLRVIKEVEALADVPSEANDIEIIPAYKMGEIVNEDIPLLAARMSGEGVEVESLRVIVDGTPYNPDFKEETGIISLQLGNPLTQKFHVVTFEAANMDGEIKRETRIFYIR